MQYFVCLIAIIEIGHIKEYPTMGYNEDVQTSLVDERRI